MTTEGMRDKPLQRQEEVFRICTAIIKAQVSSIWAKGCILMIVCVLSDLTSLPLLGGGRKSWYITAIGRQRKCKEKGTVLQKTGEACCR